MDPLSNIFRLLESVMRRDPGHRGLASAVVGGQPLLAGQLALAATDLAKNAQLVAIVTGFVVVRDGKAAAETDGPLGAIYLARALTDLGIEVVLISDSYAVEALRFGCRRYGIRPENVLEFPIENDALSGHAANAWVEGFLEKHHGARPRRPLTHLVSIERPGPSHTVDSISLMAQELVQEFCAAVPPECRDICHSMLGQSISPWTASTHRLFDVVQSRNLPVTTIGIGDGGNELGMGAISWDTLRGIVSNEAAARTACRIVADRCLLAGVSNWGAYGLALAVAAAGGQLEKARAWSVADQQELLELLVHEMGLVDGVTGRAEATVDGLSPEVYFEVLANMRQLLGLEA